MASKQFPHPFGAISERYRTFRSQLPIVVANMAVNEFKGNFRREGYQSDSGVVKWKARKIQEKTKRTLLVKSGRLKRSLRPSTRGDYAIVSSNVPYAEIHNEGGTISGTQSVRSFRRKDGSRVRGFKRSVHHDIPARPFMITTTKLLSDINNYIETGVGKIFEDGNS